jgi:hypothetical protein
MLVFLVFSSPRCKPGGVRSQLFTVCLGNGLAAALQIVHYRTTRNNNEHNFWKRFIEVPLITSLLWLLAWLVYNLHLILFDRDTGFRLVSCLYLGNILQMQIVSLKLIGLFMKVWDNALVMVVQLIYNFWIDGLSDKIKVGYWQAEEEMKDKANLTF